MILLGVHVGLSRVFVFVDAKRYRCPNCSGSAAAVSLSPMSDTKTETPSVMDVSMDDDLESERTSQKEFESDSEFADAEIVSLNSLSWNSCPAHYDLRNVCCSYVVNFMIILIFLSCSIIFGSRYCESNVLRRKTP